MKKSHLCSAGSTLLRHRVTLSPSTPGGAGLCSPTTPNPGAGGTPSTAPQLFKFYSRKQLSQMSQLPLRFTMSHPPSCRLLVVVVPLFFRMGSKHREGTFALPSPSWMVNGAELKHHVQTRQAGCPKHKEVAGEQLIFPQLMPKQPCLAVPAHPSSHLPDCQTARPTHGLDSSSGI